MEKFKTGAQYSMGIVLVVIAVPWTSFAVNTNITKAVCFFSFWLKLSLFQVCQSNKIQKCAVCMITSIKNTATHSSKSIYFYFCSLQIPHNFHDIELKRIADYILVSQRQVFTLAWQGHSSSIYIKMSPEFVGRVCGLCGNFNADVQDDLKTSYGKIFWL